LATGAAVCNSSLGAGSGCLFYNVTLGDITVNCSGTTQCYGATTSTGGHGHGGGFGGGRSSATPNGALSTSSTSFNEAYGTGTGWNFASGIGSVNAYNLVMSWHAIQ
jgi:hypothetical protein